MQPLNPVTNHQYLEKYPIKKDSKKLILGTIHPHDHENFYLPFFYGNTLSIWKLMCLAFPEEIREPITLEEILTFLHNRRTSISDVISLCSRIKMDAEDKNLTEIVFNPNLIKSIKDSEIEEIYFTSGFEKNNAFRLFYNELLGFPITKEIRENRTVTLSDDIFGREVKLIVLYSPSGRAATGVSKSKLYQLEKDKYSNSKTPVKSYLVDYYRTKFS